MTPVYAYRDDHIWNDVRSLDGLMCPFHAVDDPTCYLYRHYGVVTATDPGGGAQPVWRYLHGSGCTWYTSDPARRGDTLPVDRGWVLPS